MEDADMADSTMPDAAMMDANIDDLFGEAADDMAADGLGVVALPTAPIPPSLVMGIMEMQNKGCCTKLDWAATGSIAQISPDGRRIGFGVVSRNQQTGTWSLAEESGGSSLLAPDGAIWQHIQFSRIGINLAAVNSRGAVVVYTLIGTLGGMGLPPTNVKPAEKSRSDLEAVVGMHWLPIYPTEFKVSDLVAAKFFACRACETDLHVKLPFLTPATKIGEKWDSSMRHRSGNEPSVHHPADGKDAMLYVTKEAKLTLTFPNEIVWHTVSVKLESISSSDELLSHAAMTQDGDHLLLVTHDQAKRFRLYKITITWNATQHTRPNGPPFTTVAPTIEVAHLTSREHVAAQHADTTRLSGLHFIPVIPNNAADQSTPTYPTILAIFTRASIPTDPSQQHQEAFSVIARWHVESTTPTLHESFAKLKVNGATPSQSAVTELRRQEDIITNKLVLSVNSQHLNTMLAFCASDGTIEFRERVTMTSVEPYGDTTTVSSLPQAGFEQMMIDHSPHVAMSPDGSALVSTDFENKLTYKVMALRYSWQPLEDGISDTRGLIEAAVVCIARQYAILTCASTTSDEALALIPPDLSTDMRALFIREVIKMMKRPFDLSMIENNKQQALVIKDPLTHRALSAQFAIGVQPGTMERSFAGKFAFAFLNMRITCSAIMQLVARPDLFGRPDVFVSLRGVVLWAADLLCYIVESLVRVQRQRSTNSSPHEIAQDFITTTQNPAFHILLSTSARAQLRFLASTIPKYLNGVTSKALANARTVLERQQLEEVLHQGTSIPFKYTYFEQFAIEVDTNIRDNYTKNGIPTERRTEIELTTLTEPLLPSELTPVIDYILSTALPKFSEHIDQSALYFRDTSWLGIEQSSEVPSGCDWQYDILRKLPLTKNMKLRVCRRCGARMEDFNQDRLKEAPQWFAHMQRHCICGNYWILEES